MKKVKWTKKKQGIFLKRLGSLLQKGYSLLSALEFLQLQETPEFAMDIQLSIDQLRQGIALYQVFERKKFHQDVLGYLFYAQRHGDIATTLEKAGLLLEGREKQQQKLVKIIKYPLFLLVFLSILLLFFNWVLLPQFQSMFQTFYGGSHSSMMILFSLLSLFPKFVYLVVFLIFLGILLYFFYFRKQTPLVQMKLKLKIPYFKIIFRMLNTHYIAHQLGTLLQAGLSISEGCVLMGEQKHHLFFKNEASELHSRLKQGYGLDTVVKERDFYDKHFAFIVAHGLANGTLGQELADYSEYILERLEETIKKGLNVIQPVVYTIIAVVVVLIYVAMLLPMLEMISLI